MNISFFPQKPMIYGRRKGRPLRHHKTVLIEQMLPQLEFHLSSEGHLPINLFENKKPLCLEIGYGTGDHLIAQLKANPDCNFIGCEPFVGGIARFLDKLSSSNLSFNNIKLFTKDAQSLLKSFKKNSLEKIFILFPDPWPKKKHLKRRFFQQDVLEEILRVLDPLGTLVLASDHEDYFSAMQTLVKKSSNLILLKEDLLINSEDPSLRPPSWPLTRFEKKAHLAGRTCRYLIAQKINF